jgi:hypothetical protein
MSPPSAHIHATRTLHRRYWQRSILVPLWTQQLLLQICSVIIFWFAITIYWTGGPKHGPPKGSNPREQAILASFFVLYLALLLATLGEILLYCANTLQPKGYLASQLLKTVASAGVWATLGVYPYAIRDPVGNRTQVTVGLEVLFLWVQCVVPCSSPAFANACQNPDALVPRARPARVARGARHPPRGGRTRRRPGAAAGPSQLPARADGADERADAAASQPRARRPAPCGERRVAPSDVTTFMIFAHGARHFYGA